MHERILITGCAGALGEAVERAFAGTGALCATDVNARGGAYAHLDITSATGVRDACEAFRPTAIVNLAALTDLEYCETHPHEAYEVNAWGAARLMREARRRGIPFVHITTAGVFDGTEDVYAEEDAHKANPVNVYGKSKYAGELAVREYGRSIIIRCGWMIGGGPERDAKFAGLIIRQLAGGAREIYALHDKRGTPSYTYDTARAIAYLLERRAYGLHNSVCAGAASRADVARALVAAFKKTDSVAVREVAHDHFRDRYFAARPASEALSWARLARLHPPLVRDWRACVEEYAARFGWGVV